ncbi:hypothetical protein FXO38_19586 [Capsicum annuum]|nr:hypothetical protein FXO38_19586 [Capsicum annuum]
MSKYYPGIEKVRKSDFYTDFVANENFFKEDDLYEIGMVYFIIRFLVSDLPRNYIPKFYFDLVKSGEYLNYDWDNECFRMLYKYNSHGLKTNSSSFTFGGFHLALQIWFYECCLNLDKAVAIQSESVMSPRILNWRSSKDLIFNEYLKTTMFKHYSNEKNDSRSADDLLQTPNESKTCEQIPNEPIKVKDELSRDMAFEMDDILVDQFTDWSYAKKVRERNTKTNAQDVIINPEFELGGLKIDKKGWFLTIIHTDRLWNDEHVDVIMYYLQKKAKYSMMKPITYTTTDVWFIKWVCAIEQQWLSAKKDMRYISPKHYVGQYIRGFKMLANVSWDIVYNIIIPVNVSESFHWIMILFRIRHRCLYVYDSFIGGALNTKNVHRHVQSLATIIPLFLFATDFYRKRADIC